VTSTLREVCSRSGAKLVVDDFGAGYSNLKRVVEIEPAVVKLDRELISGLHQNPKQRLLVTHVVELCKALGARVVAEGIETIGELKASRDCGVHYGQGYLLARPGNPLPEVSWPLGAPAPPSRPSRHLPARSLSPRPAPPRPAPKSTPPRPAPKSAPPAPRRPGRTCRRGARASGRRRRSRPRRRPAAAAAAAEPAPEPDRRRRPPGSGEPWRGSAAGRLPARGLQSSTVKGRTSRPRRRRLDDGRRGVTAAGRLPDRADADDADVRHGAVEGDVAAAADDQVARLVPEQGQDLVVVHVVRERLQRISGAAVDHEQGVTGLDRQPGEGRELAEAGDDQIAELELYSP
jgi:hypothetical protein